MNILIVGAICFFLAGSCYFLINWFTFFRHQSNPSVEDRFLAFTILIVATTFWVLLIPFYCLKLLTKTFFNRSQTPAHSITSETESIIEYSELLARKYKIKSTP